MSEKKPKKEKAPKEEAAQSEATKTHTEKQADPQVEREEPVHASSGSDGQEMKQTKLVETDKYLNTGSHIGTKFKSGDMRQYIYKVRKDGLNVLDVQTIDDRLKFVAKFLSKFPAERIAVVSRKSYGQTPVKTFAESTGAITVTGRFIPGTFTNPQCTRFVEPLVVVITDPEYDFQAIEEATTVRIPVVALCSTNNTLKNIDIAVPINNKGRKSLALAYWILAKEILAERNDGTTFTKPVEDFEYKMKEGEEDEQKRAFDRERRGSNMRGKGGRFDRRGGSSRGPPRGGSGRPRTGGFGGGGSSSRSFGRSFS